MVAMKRVERTGIYRSPDGVHHFHRTGADHLGTPFQMPADEEFVRAGGVVEPVSDPDEFEGRSIPAAPENKMVKVTKTKNPDSVAAKLEGS